MKLLGKLWNSFSHGNLFMSLKWEGCFWKHENISQDVSRCVGLKKCENLRRLDFLNDKLARVHFSGDLIRDFRRICSTVYLVALRGCCCRRRSGSSGCGWSRCSSGCCCHFQEGNEWMSENCGRARDKSDKWSLAIAATATQANITYWNNIFDLLV